MRLPVRASLVETRLRRWSRLINDDGDVVETSGHRGEICVRGPRVMSGYLGDANATANAFIDGWLRTGDVGMIDEKGHIFIVDRAKV